MRPHTGAKPCIVRFETGNDMNMQLRQDIAQGADIDFIARKVFLVLGTRDGAPIHVHISLNDAPAEKLSGADVDKKTSTLTVDHGILYELIDQKQSINGIVELKADEPGLQAYAFTFGG